MSDRSALMIHGSGSTRVDEDVADCPECGSTLFVDAWEWDPETGRPTTGGLNVNCVDDNDGKHQYFIPDWQPTIETVERWARCL